MNIAANVLIVLTPSWWPLGIGGEPLGVAQPELLSSIPHLHSAVCAGLWGTWNQFLSFKTYTPDPPIVC